MVKLTKIYTRGGDAGQTSLGDGSRVAKHESRPEAYGSVDEANAAVGVARVAVQAEGDAKSDALLARIQNDLFDLGADLCRPGPDLPDKPALRVAEGQVQRLEAEIDAMNANLADLTSFILPGGRPSAAHLHLARTIARRAEREMTRLAEIEDVNPHAIAYINRLSDHLFVLARHMNADGAEDVLWVPGKNL